MAVPRRIRPSSLSIPPFVSRIARAQKHIVLPPVHQRVHVDTNRTIIQDEELSAQHTDNVAFDQLTQRVYDRAVKDDVLNSRLHFTILDAFWRSDQHRHERLLANPERIPNRQPGESCFIITETFQHVRPRTYRMKSPTPSD